VNYELRLHCEPVDGDGCFRLDDSGPPVSYAFSSDWDLLEPLILAHLRGKEQE